jgi:hypothetical protein
LLILSTVAQELVDSTGQMGDMPLNDAGEVQFKKAKFPE